MKLQQTLVKAALKLARAAWLVFFAMGLLAGADYLFTRDDLGLALFMGGLGVAALPWAVLTWIARQLQRADAEAEAQSALPPP